MLFNYFLIFPTAVVEVFLTGSEEWASIFTDLFTEIPRLLSWN